MPEYSFCYNNYLINRLINLVWNANNIKFHRVKKSILEIFCPEQADTKKVKQWLTVTKQSFDLGLVFFGIFPRTCETKMEPFKLLKTVTLPSWYHPGRHAKPCRDLASGKRIFSHRQVFTWNSKGITCKFGLQFSCFQSTYFITSGWEGGISQQSNGWMKGGGEGRGIEPKLLVFSPHITDIPNRNLTNKITNMLCFWTSLLASCSKLQ